MSFIQHHVFIDMASVIMLNVAMLSVKTTSHIISDTILASTAELNLYCPSSTVVEQSTQNLKIEGSNPASSSGIEKMVGKSIMV
jgi:hypothetical protein